MGIVFIRCLYSQAEGQHNSVSVLQLCSPSQYLYVRGNVENTFLVFQEQNCHSFSSPATNGQIKKEKPSTNRGSLPSLDVGKQALTMIQS